MRIERHGLRAELPEGWEGRIFRRAIVEARATSHPVLHAATFPLPMARGDFGSEATELMGPGDVFLALVEYDPEATKTALFARRGMPRLRADSFSPAKLQRHLPGLAGSQFFFTHLGRAFCLYVVLGSFADRRRLVARAEQALATIHVESAVPIPSNLT